MIEIFFKIMRVTLFYMFNLFIGYNYLICYYIGCNTFIFSNIKLTDMHIYYRRSLVIYIYYTDFIQFVNRSP